MSMLIIILIVIIIIAVLSVWWISSNMKNQADGNMLLLNNNEDKIISEWLKSNVKPSLNVNITPEEIASKFIKSIYNYDVNHNNIVVGSDLENKYFKLTKNKIGTTFSHKEDCILYLRASMGIDYEIIIINSNNKLKEQLSRKNESVNLFILNDAINSKNDKIAYKFMRELLNERWNKLINVNNTDLLPREINDSYLYLKNNNDSQVYNNITTLITDKGLRINLLCSHNDFEQLIKRLNITRQTNLGL